LRLVRRVDLSTAAGVTFLKAFPGAAQVFRIERVRATKDDAPRTWSYHITSLSAATTDAQRLGEIVRAHWLIENGSHYIRDKVYGEDRCRCHTGRLPEILAIARSTGIAYAAKHGLAHASVHRQLGNDLCALSIMLGVWIAPGLPPARDQAA
jgi:predicted transposase YbfD/YdcC